MDDLTTNSNSNSISNSNSSTSSKPSINTLTNANGLSYYELALKKLNQILKSKANDVTKQLDDLWDSINQSNGTNSINQKANVLKSALSNGKSVNSVSRASPTNILTESTVEASNTVNKKKQINFISKTERVLY